MQTLFLERYTRNTNRGYLGGESREVGIQGRRETFVSFVYYLFLPNLCSVI